MPTNRKVPTRPPAPRQASFRGLTEEQWELLGPDNASASRSAQRIVDYVTDHLVEEATAAQLNAADWQAICEVVASQKRANPFTLWSFFATSDPGFGQRLRTLPAMQRLAVYEIAYQRVQATREEVPA
jgi:hypothetical protein